MAVCSPERYDLGQPGIAPLVRRTTSANRQLVILSGKTKLMPKVMVASVYEVLVEMQQVEGRPQKIANCAI